jgi:hypothetical protein
VSPREASLLEASSREASPLEASLLEASPRARNNARSATAALSAHADQSAPRVPRRSSNEKVASAQPVTAPRVFAP